MQREFRFHGTIYRVICNVLLERELSRREAIECLNDLCHGEVARRRRQFVIAVERGLRGRQLSQWVGTLERISGCDRANTAS